MSNATVNATQAKLLRQIASHPAAIYAPCDDKTFGTRVRALARKGLVTAHDSGWHAVLVDNLDLTRKIRGASLTPAGKKWVEDHTCNCEGCDNCTDEDKHCNRAPDDDHESFLGRCEECGAFLDPDYAARLAEEEEEFLREAMWED